MLHHTRVLLLLLYVVAGLLRGKENVRRYILQKYVRATTRRVYYLFCVFGVLLEMGSTADVVDMVLKIHCDPAHVTHIKPPFK